MRLFEKNFLTLKANCCKLKLIIVLVSSRSEGVMFGWRQLIAAFARGLFVCAAVRADMAPVSLLGAESLQSEQPCSRGESPRTNSPSLFGSLGTADFSSWPVEFLPEAGTHGSQFSELPLRVPRTWCWSPRPCSSSILP